MPTKINCNKTEFYGGIFLLFLCLVGVSFCSYNLISAPPKPFFSNRGIRNGAIVVLGFFTIARYIKSRYLTP
jgi:hypothetical protein